MIVERNLHFGVYEFEVIINPANVAARMQRDVFYKTERTDEMFVRSFFFDEIVPEKITQFCEQFALDADFRSASIQRIADWAIKNDLFLRNCFNPYFQPNPFLEQIGSLVRAYTFFQNHAIEIINQPDYQRIYQQDSALDPLPHQPDPAIADVVRSFNQIEGVATLASCQGVSASVSYQNHDIMTLSPHARFAYVWFATIPTEIELEIRKLSFQHTIYNNEIYPMLVSTGDNSAYIDEIRLLADTFK